MLRRLGHKAKLASKIISHFPKHDRYVELFFGAGGIFFNKPRANHNIVNDIDDEIYNLWKVVQDDKKGLYDEIAIMPISMSLFKHWVKNKETDPMLKAMRFLFLSNFSCLGASTTLSLDFRNTKEVLLKNINSKLFDLSNVVVTCMDFRKILSCISFKEPLLGTPFIYADPPYLGTADNYSQSFTLDATLDLFKILVNSGHRFAISEFNNPIILDISKSYNLNIIPICERRTIKNRNVEILITNYSSNTLF